MSALLWSGSNSDCEGVMDTVQLKHCPICTEDLPLSEFGIVRARAHLDGKNLYCKSCIREKVALQRQALKEYKALRRARANQETELAEQFGSENLWTEKSMWKLAPVERVKNAIQAGARTQREIAEETKLGKDEIGDALANLLLWTHEIRTQIVDDTRLYFLNVVEEKPEPEYAHALPFCEVARKSNQLVVKGEKSIRRVA